MTFFIAFVAASAAACLVAALVKGGGSVLGLPVDGRNHGCHERLVDRIRNATRN